MTTTTSSVAWRRSGLVWVAEINGCHCTIRAATLRNGLEGFRLQVDRKDSCENTEHLSVDEAKVYAEEHA